MKLYIISRYKIQSLEISCDPEFIIDDIIQIAKVHDTIITVNKDMFLEISWPTKYIYEIDVRRLAT